MRSYYLVLVLLSSSVGLSAQQAHIPQPTTFAIFGNGTGCPVNFGAELDGRLTMRSASKQHRNLNKPDDAPLLEFTFQRLETPRIVRATVIVHGSSAQSLYLPVSDYSNANRTQVFTLDKESGAAGLAHREVEVTKMLFVRWAEVTELRYADGSAWHASADRECRAALNLFHLVDAPASAR